MLKKIYCVFLLGLFFTLLFAFGISSRSFVLAAKCSNSVDEILISLSTNEPTKKSEVIVEYTTENDHQYSLFIYKEDDRDAGNVWHKDLDKKGEGIHQEIVLFEAIPDLEVGVRYYFEIREYEDPKCGKAGFHVRAEGEPPTPPGDKPEFTDPPKSFAYQGWNTLPKIRVVRVPQGTYRFALDGAWGGDEIDAKDRGGKDFSPTADGIIEVTMICRDGGAFQDDCREKFPIGEYLIELVTKETSEAIASTTFTIESPLAGGDVVIATLPATINTPFGPIPAESAAFASKVLSIAVGIGGGIAFLLMVFGSYRLIYAGGDPEAIQQGRQVITAAIIGLLVIVFSVFILQLIGISILGLNITR